MPIRPENKSRYPRNWKALRAAVLERAGHKCEQCGVPNHAYRNSAGGWTSDHIQAGEWIENGDRVTQIVLTIAHLDHDELETQDISRLRAWCQRDHLAYDHAHHMRTARTTRHNRKAAAELF